MKLTIEVTSDFICPWCRIAEARLDGVLKALPEDVEVEVKWLPFELNPDMPNEGMDRQRVKAFLASHEGEAEIIQQEDFARRSRINSVPSFYIGGVRIAGAVSAEVLNQHIYDAINNKPTTEVKDAW